MNFRPRIYLVEADHVDVVEQLREQLYREGGIDAAPAQQCHGRPQHRQDQPSGGIVVDVLRQKLVQRLRQLNVENRHQIAECGLHALGQHLLCLDAEGRNVPVGFEEVQKLRTVGHPKGQDFGIGVLLLNDVLDQIGNVMKEYC